VALVAQRPPRPWQVTAPRGAITKISPHSYAVHIAGAALAELLYETGELAKVRTILDESPEFGTALGGVDFMVARYVTVARIKAADGDIDAARTWLADGMEAAANLHLPGLAARIDNEWIRLGGIPLASATAARLREPREPEHHDGTERSPRSSMKPPRYGC
jgi:serine/threonine-protein kinase PknK